MTLEFIKAHTTKDGRHYTAGQLADIADVNLAQELIRQGIAKERKPGEAETPAGGKEPTIPKE